MQLMYRIMQQHLDRIYSLLCDIIFFTFLKTIIMKTLLPIIKEEVELTVNSYEPPVIELIEVTVEKGFADSITNWKK